MRTPYVLAASAMLLATPAFAQSGSTMTPPSPNSSQSAPTPTGSVPSGSLTTGRTGAGGGGTSSSTQGLTHPRAKTSSGTHRNPSAAFARTVPRPAVGTKE